MPPALAPRLPRACPALVHLASSHPRRGDGEAAFVGAQDTDVASGGQGVFKQGENKKAADALTMGNANHQIGFEEFLLIMSSLAQRSGRTLSTERAQKLYNVADRAGKGFVDFGDFLVLEQKKKAMLG